MQPSSKEQKIKLYNQKPRKCEGCNQDVLVSQHSKLVDTDRKRFCSRSCAVATTNRTHPRHRNKKQRECIACASAFETHGETRLQQQLCLTCYVKEANKSGETTISKISHSHIRAHARRVLPPEGGSCACCGYNVFVEICHINPVSSFPDSTLLSVVNDPSNLIRLCPNHHKELDFGHLDKDELKAFASAAVGWAPVRRLGKARRAVYRSFDS